MTKEIDNYQVSLKILLENEQGETLILKDIPIGGYAGYYDLPGGRLDVDEFDIPLEQSIDRELKEEVGMIDYRLEVRPVAVGRHWLKRPDKPSPHVLLLFFKAYYFGGEIILTEHESYEWVNLRDIALEKYFTSGILDGVRMYLAYYV